MKTLRKFLSVIVLAFSLIGGITSGYCAETNVPTESEYGMADVGDYGSWATENNRKRFISGLTYDIEQFRGENAGKQLVKDYVPIEAKIGMAFMNAFSYISHVLNHSLNRFIIVFIIAMIGYWLTLEIITIMQ